MNGFAIVLLSLLGPAWPNAGTLDKNGTTGPQNQEVACGMLQIQVNTEGRSNPAEREGFSDRGSDAVSREEQLLNILESSNCTSR